MLCACDHKLLLLVLPCWRCCCPHLQVPDEEKRRRADYIIDTGCSLQETEQQVASILQELKGRQGMAAARLLGQLPASEAEGS